MSITIVTCYYKFRSKHSLKEYELWINNFMKIKTKTIIFTDEDSKDILMKYKQSNHQIVIIEKKNWLTQKYKDKFNIFYSNDPEKYHTINLYMVWNEKTNFLIKAMELTNSEYLMWTDIGCFRNSKIMDKYINWPDYNKLKIESQDRILMTQVFKYELEELYTVDKNDFPMFKSVNRIGGSIFGGNRDKLIDFYNVYYSVLDSYFNLSIDRYEGKDQSIMSYIRLKHPDLVMVKFKEEEWFYFHELLI